MGTVRELALDLVIVTSSFLDSLREKDKLVAHFLLSFCNYRALLDLLIATS